MINAEATVLRWKILGVLLRSARVHAGLTLADCAGALGISARRMSEYERGKRGISLPELEILARLLRRPLAYFLIPPPRIEEPPNDSSPAVWIASRRAQIGRQIREMRRAANMSQKALAGQLGVSVRRLSAYERGMRDIPLLELETIAEILGLSVGQFAAPQENEESLYSLSHLPDELIGFVVEPGSVPYLRMAAALSQLSPEELGHIGKVFSSVNTATAGADESVGEEQPPAQESHEGKSETAA